MINYLIVQNEKYNILSQICPHIMFHSTEFYSNILLYLEQLLRNANMHFKYNPSKQVNIDYKY